MDPLQRLTRRERDVMRLMAQGRTNSAISRELCIGGGAVEKNVSPMLPADGTVIVRASVGHVNVVEVDAQEASVDPDLTWALGPSTPARYPTRRVSLTEGIRPPTVIVIP